MFELGLSALSWRLMLGTSGHVLGLGLGLLLGLVIHVGW